MSTVADDESESRTRVWYLITALSVGGAERRLIDLASGIDSDQYDPTVVTLFDHNPLAGDLAEHVGLRCLGGRARIGDGEGTAVEAAGNPLEYARLPASLARSVRRGRPDVLHSFLFYDNLLARFAGVFAPGTTVITEALGFRSSSRREVLLADRLTRRLSDRVVANSEAGGQYFAGRGIPRDRVSVIPGGRDLTPFLDPDPTGLAAELGVATEGPIVGTVGRMVPRKGHRDLLDAWEIVLETHPDAHLLLVGDGPEMGNLKARAEAAGIAGSVSFPGIRTETPELLALMDVFAFPSHWEGLPGALIEAMAAGVPIVATDVAGNEELIEDGKTGLLVPGEHPPSLARSIGALLYDPDRAAELGRAAREEAHRRFTTDRLIADMEALYAEVTADG